MFVLSCKLKRLSLILKWWHLHERQSFKIALHPTFLGGKVWCVGGTVELIQFASDQWKLLTLLHRCRLNDLNRIYSSFHVSFAWSYHQQLLELAMTFFNLSLALNSTGNDLERYVVSVGLFFFNAFLHSVWQSNFSVLLYSLGKLQLHPDNGWLMAWLKVMIKTFLSASKKYVTINMLYAFLTMFNFTVDNIHALASHCAKGSSYMTTKLREHFFSSYFNAERETFCKPIYGGGVFWSLFIANKASRDDQMVPSTT